MLNLDKFIGNDTAVLICTETNRRYLSSVKSSLGYLLICELGSFLFVDGRYYEAAVGTANSDIKVVLLTRLSKQLGDLFKRFKIKTLYTETEITVGFLSSIKNVLHCDILPNEELSRYLLISRSVKKRREIDNIISAQRIAERAYLNVLDIIKEGIREKEIALELDYQMQKMGSEGISFETIAVSGENSALPHGVPTERALRKGDFLTLDFGAVVNGYHSDMTRTVAIGEATDEMQEIYNLVLSAQRAAIEKIAVGVDCKSVDAAARDIITHKGYAGNFNHSTGHGVGLDIHEYPTLSQRNNEALLENQVVTVEPGVYLPNKFGVRIEDMIVVGRNINENLTKCEKKLIIL
ncbi:MAG: aminopeptidase P family protein [Acutalibacteraceae bacterium]|nr:aminopeptidase P family protein [Acutalibacteraceae bacterium]